MVRTELQDDKLVDTAGKSHLYKNVIGKRVCKKELETCFLIITKGEKIGTTIHNAFSIKPVAHFAGLESRLHRAPLPRTPRHSTLSREPSHARKT